MLVKLKDESFKEVSLLSYEEVVEQLKFLKNIKKLRNKQINESLVKIKELEDRRENDLIKICSINDKNQKIENKLKNIDKTIQELSKNRLLLESRISTEPYTKFVKYWEYFEECQNCE